MRLTKIKIYGRLRKFCNNEKSFEASIKKPLDAISFLKCNFKGLDKHMANQHYCIKVRGEEITEEVLESEKSYVFDQAENRLHIQQALLAVQLGGL